MNEERLRDLYARGIAARDARRPAGVAEDVTPEELQALVRGELAEERRLELLDRVMGSERLRAEFELLRAVEVAGRRAASAAVPASADLPLTGEVPEISKPSTDARDARVLPFDAPRATRRRRSWAWRSMAVPAALAALLLLAVSIQVGRNGDPEAGDVLRGRGESLTVVSPPEEVALSDSMVFAWRAVPGATQYQLEILDGDGLPVRETTTTDTVVVVAARGLMEPDDEYRWSVRATDGAGAQLSSAVRRLRVLDQ